MDPDEPPLDSLEDEALPRRLAELQAQVQLEEQRAMQRQKEQCRQAAIEEERRLQERLRQLQQDREAEEQAHCPALPSLPLSRHVPSHEQHPQMATDIKRSATAVPGHQCLSVSEAPVQSQEAHQEEQTEQRTEDVVLFNFMGPSLSESTGAQTVFVSCLSPTTSDECIGIFFENKRRNGGGPIKKLLRLNEVTALVHFRNHQDAESVVKKGHHMLDGSWLQVSLLNLEQFCERNVAVSSFSTGAQTVFVSCLSPTTSDECIGIFFENKHRNGGGPIKKLLRLNEVTALVHFRNHQDAESVVEKGHHMLDGSWLQVSLLNLEQFCERNVAVSSFSTGVCESKALALESKCILPKINVLSKVQGSVKDADCSKSEFEEQGEVGMEKHTIPSLKPWQVRFLKTPRVLDRFYKHYPGLEVSVDEERKTAELRAPRDIMKKAFSDVVSFVTRLREVKIPLSPALVKMYEKEDSVEWVQTTLIDKHQLVCHWELCGDRLVLCSQSSDLPQLEKMFKSAFTEVKVNMRPEEMGVLKSLKWTSFKKQQTRPNCPSPVFFHSGDSIIIVDTPSNVSRVRLALQQLLHEVSHDVQEDSIPNLKPCQVKVLNIPRALEFFDKKYPGLEVSVDEDTRTAEVRAPGYIMTRALYDVLYFVTCLREVKIPLSPALVKMYEKEDSIEWIQTTLIDKHRIVCHWELCGDRLLLCGQSSDLPQLEKMFKSAFTEVKVKMHPAEADAMQSPKWTSFVETQNGLNCPVPVFFPSGDSIIIVDTPSSISKTQLALRQFLDEISNEMEREAISNLTSSQMKVLSIPSVLDVLYKHYPGLEVSVDEERKIAELRAPGDIMMRALYDVLSFVTCLREVKIPLSPALVKMYEKEDSVEWIQTTLIDKHRRVCHWELCGDHLVLCGQSSDLPQLEKMFKSAFTEVKVKMHPAEADAMQSPKWTSFVETQNGLNCPVPVFFPSGDSIIIVDTPSSISKTQLALRQFLDEISNEMEREAISNLTSSQMKVLSIPSALDVLYKHYPGLEVSVDEERKIAELRAPGDIMMRALYDVLSFVTCLREVKIPLSPALVKMYEKEDSVEWIQTTLIDKHRRVCHWELCGDHLVLCGQSSDLPQLEKMFKSAFTEVKVKMHPAEADAMQSPKWTSFVETQNGLNCPVPVFFPSGDSIIIVDTPSSISKSQLALRQFLDEINNEMEREAISNLTSSQMKVLSIPSALDVLYKHYPGLEVSVDEERKIAELRAPGDIMMRALYDVLSFVTCLREVKIPLSPALVKMYEKEDSVEWIQTTLIDKHRIVCHWELCGDRLVLCGQSSDLPQLEQMFKSAFTEVEVDRSPQETGAMGSLKWLSFAERRNRPNFPAPLFLPAGHNIVIVDTPSNVNETQTALRCYLDENSSKTDFCAEASSPGI